MVNLDENELSGMEMPKKTFSALYIRNAAAEKEAVRSSLVKEMKKAGFKPLKSDSAASVTLRVDFFADKRISVISDPPVFDDTGETEAFVGSLSEALNADVPVASPDGADVKRIVGAYLRGLGFTKKKKYYVKNIREDLFLAVRIVREALAAYYVAPNVLRQSGRPSFDLCVAVTTLSSVEEDSFLDNSLNTLSRVPLRERIAGLTYSPEEIADKLIHDFEKYVYSPLFQEKDAFFDLYDYMCWLEYRTRCCVFEDSYDKALAAFYERRFYEAALCLKRIFRNALLNNGDCPEGLAPENVTDRQIEKLRATDRGLSECFALYDKITAVQKGN